MDMLKNGGNLNAAHGWIEYAAERNHQPALETLIRISDQLPDSSQQHWLSLVADNNVDARLKLANLYIDKQRQYYRPQQAFKLFQSLVELNIPEAKVKMGLFYLQPPNNRKPPFSLDIPTARMWLEQANSIGYESLELSLGLANIALHDQIEKILNNPMTENISFIPELEEALKDGPTPSDIALQGVTQLKQTLHSKQPIEGIKKLQNAAKNNDSVALIWLGALHQNGVFFNQDLKKANALYQQAWRLGNPVAAYQLGQASLMNLDDPQNITHAQAFFQMASEHGSNKGTFSLSMLMIFNDEFEKAEKLLLSHASKQKPRYFTILGVLYGYNKSKYPPQKSIDFQQKGWNLGDLYAGFTLHKTNIKTLQHYLQMAAEEGHYLSQIEFCRSNLKTNSSDIILKRFQHCLAAEKVNAHAFYAQLSTLYDTSDFILANSTDTKKLLLLASHFEGRLVQRNIGLNKYYGENNFKQNTNAAYQHFSKAAKLGECISMGYMAKLAISHAKDIKTLASNKPNYPACYYWTKSMLLSMPTLNDQQTIQLNNHCSAKLSPDQKIREDNRAKIFVQQHKSHPFWRENCTKLLANGWPYDYNNRFQLNLRISKDQ
ncbi:MAG: sel1 repeat family protein [Methylococcales bacterium]|jgi:TPR repeat protein|nr:sel1 repeat family protein [Methylococcales bacterium]MBT7442420.1 sel1 repeat family protein [Methylococcales bacterium]